MLACSIAASAVGVVLYTADSAHVRAEEKNRLHSIFQVEASPLVLNVASSLDRSVGELSYVGGWQLTSLNPDFGGWSGLTVTENGTRLTAISDKGIVMQAVLDVASSTPLSDVAMTLYPGRTMDKPKASFDAESIIRTGDGYYVSFEGDHRLEFVPNDFLDAIPVPVRTGVDYSVMAKNAGLEAIVLLADGSLVMFAENGRDPQGTLPMWVSKNGEATARRFQPPRNYAPTDAAVLPCGDLLLLTRRYSVLEGVSSKVVYVSASALQAGGILRGREIAHLEAPLPVDNMEALDIVVLPDGYVRLYMMSDDNFNPMQDTLLLVFDWKLPQTCRGNTPS